MEVWLPQGSSIAVLHWAGQNILTGLYLSLLLSLASCQLDLPRSRDNTAEGFGDQPDGRLDTYGGVGRQQDQRFNDFDYRNILARLDFLGADRCSENVGAQWSYETNVNEYTQLQALEAQRLYAIFQNQAWQLISKLDGTNVMAPNVARRLKYLSAVGPAALPLDQLDRYNRIINDMLSIYNSATICAYNDPFRCGLRLHPDISRIMTKSRDWDELQWVWTEWRRQSGSQIRDLYEQLVQLNNNAAKLNIYRVSHSKRCSQITLQGKE